MDRAFSYRYLIRCSLKSRSQNHVTKQSILGQGRSPMLELGGMAKEQSCSIMLGVDHILYLLQCIP